jgi:cytochrome c oxidase cbb3-type subunit 3
MNNPLPRWWIYLFYLTIVFTVVYLVLYPGFGANKGTFGWTQVSQYEAEVAKANAAVEPLFAKYLKQDIAEVAADPQARAMGERMYLTYCVQCHGSDARGSKGFPNLSDNDWLHGGDGPTLVKTISEGRIGMMPPMGAAVGTASDVENLANYVLSMSGSAHDAVKAELGKPKFAACAACHGADGKGNPQLGAPNLTDKVWLYGGSLATVVETINKGRSNQMPAFKDLLAPGKVQVLAAYVWSLSNTPKAAAAQK